MSLRAFHVLFIVVSIILAFAFGGWALRVEPGGVLYRAMGVASLVVGAGLVGYAAWFVRKTKRLPR